MQKEETFIKVKTERRRYGRKVTIIEGLESETNFQDLLTKLKSACACGGTVKNNIVELQGDHRRHVRKLMMKWGFPGDNIVLQ